MMELEAKTGKINNFLTSIWGVLTICGTIIGGVIGGYWWIQDSVRERDAVLISEATIEKITEQIDPISRTEVLEFRRKDSIERINAELLAIEFMNRTDSLRLVMTAEATARKSLARQLGRIEAKIDAQAMPAEDDKLARIWEFLKAKEKQDSTALQLERMMDEIRRLNQEKLKRIKSGDRAQ